MSSPEESVSELLLMMKDCEWLTDFEIRDGEVLPIWTDLGKERIKTLYAILNQDYLPTGSAVMNASERSDEWQRLASELFKGSVKVELLSVLTAIVIKFNELDEGF